MKVHIKVDCVRVVRMGIVLPKAYIMPEDAILVPPVPGDRHSYVAAMV